MYIFKMGHISLKMLHLVFSKIGWFYGYLLLQPEGVGGMAIFFVQYSETKFLSEFIFNSCLELQN